MSISQDVCLVNGKTLSSKGWESVNILYSNNNQTPIHMQPYPPWQCAKLWAFQKDLRKLSFSVKEEEKDDMDHIFAIKVK